MIKQARASRSVGLLIALAVVLAGCGHARVVQRDSQRSVQREVSVRPVAGRGEYVVARGDTLYGIAFRNGMDFRELAAINGIDAPYTIYVNQLLRLRGGNVRSPVARPVASAAQRNPNPVPSTQSSTTPTSVHDVRVEQLPESRPGSAIIDRPSTIRQILHRIYRSSIAADLEVQHVATSAAASHFGDLLASLYALAFIDQTFAVMAVRRQPFVRMFDDDQLAVADQTGTRIHNHAIGRGQHRISSIAGDIKPLPGGVAGHETTDDIARGRPTPAWAANRCSDRRNDCGRCSRLNDRRCARGRGRI